MDLRISPNWVVNKYFLWHRVSWQLHLCWSVQQAVPHRRRYLLFLLAAISINISTNEQFWLEESWAGVSAGKPTLGLEDSTHGKHLKQRWDQSLSVILPILVCRHHSTQHNQGLLDTSVHWLDRLFWKLTIWLPLCAKFIGLGCKAVMLLVRRHQYFS